LCDEGDRENGERIIDKRVDGWLLDIRIPQKERGKAYDTSPNHISAGV
jgi:hypothetical protein